MSSALMVGQNPPSGSVRVASVSTLEALITDEDTDGDNNITIDDPRVTETSRGDRRFTPRAPDDRPYEIAGTYYLSNSLAVLRVAQESGRDSIDLQYDDLVEAPVEHICGSIRERYWHGVTRTIDEKELAHIFADEKSKTVDGYNYVYVPYDDTLAQRYFREAAQRHPEWKMQVATLPASVTPEYVRRLDGRHGVLTLGIKRDSSGAVEGTPYVVPGGRLNERTGGTATSSCLAYCRTVTDRWQSRLSTILSMKSGITGSRGKRSANSSCVSSSASEPSEMERCRRNSRE